MGWPGILLSRQGVWCRFGARGYYQDALVWRVASLTLCRVGAGGYYQDALKYIPVSLGLGFLPRTVLVITPHPDSGHVVLAPQKPLAVVFAQRRGCMVP